MRTELPVCRRCCFCLPLRYGLIVWSYIKLITNFFLLTGLIIFITLVKPFDPERESVYTTIFICIALLVLVTDIVLNIVFVIGGHKKNVKLLKCFYYYSMFVVSLTIAIGIFSFGMSLYYMSKYSHLFTFEIILYDIMDSMLYVANIILQIYIMLLVRSEIVKLNNDCEFRFVNRAAEAECTLKVNQSNEQREIEIYKNGADSDEDIRIYV